MIIYYNLFFEGYYVQKLNRISGLKYYLRFLKEFIIPIAPPNLGIEKTLKLDALELADLNKKYELVQALSR